MKILYFIATALGIVASIITIYLFIIGVADTSLLPKILQSGKISATILLFLLFYLSMILIHLFCFYMRKIWVNRILRLVGQAQVEVLMHILVIVLFIWLPVISIWIEIAVELQAIHKKHSFFYEGVLSSNVNLYIFLSVGFVYLLAVITEIFIIDEMTQDVFSKKDSASKKYKN